MKKFAFFAAFLFLSVNLFSQVEQHQVIVTNVEVAIRVLDGNQFIDNLTIDDLEIYEDGVLQKIEALYLVKKRNIERKELLRAFNPALQRHFYLLFQISDYNPKLQEVTDHFIKDVLQPEDTLTLWTPVKRYDLSSAAIKSMTREKISKEMQKIIRKDTKIGLSNYRSLMRDLRMLIRAIASDPMSGGEASGVESDPSASMFGLDLLLPRYRETLQKIEDLRIVDQKMLLQFANILKRQEGENIVFFFYEREFRPELNTSTINRMMSIYQDRPNILASIQDLFQAYHRNIEFDIKKIQETFADSSLLFNFIFVNKTPETISGVSMREQSEDVFSILSEAAKATGGIIESSQNPAAGFKNALNTSQDYYLLYYSPANYRRDGKFKAIKVKVKNKDYKIMHRRGYYAN